MRNRKRKVKRHWRAAAPRVRRFPIRNPQSAIRNCCRLAFTLIELVLVTGIIAVLAAIAIPHYAGSIQRYRADAAARRIVSDLALAQSRANTTSTSQTVVFSVASNEYRIEAAAATTAGAYTVRHGSAPYQATLVTADFGGETQMSFDGYGVPTRGGTLTLRAGSVQRTIAVDATSGRAKVQ